MHPGRCASHAYSSHDQQNRSIHPPVRTSLLHLDHYAYVGNGSKQDNTAQTELTVAISVEAFVPTLVNKGYKHP